MGDFRLHLCQQSGKLLTARRHTVFIRGRNFTCIRKQNLLNCRQNKLVNSPRGVILLSNARFETAFVDANVFHMVTNAVYTGMISLLHQCPMNGGHYERIRDA